MFVGESMSLERAHQLKLKARFKKTIDLNLKKIMTKTPLPKSPAHYVEPLAQTFFQLRKSVNNTTISHYHYVPTATFEEAPPRASFMTNYEPQNKKPPKRRGSIEITYLNLGNKF